MINYQFHRYYKALGENLKENFIGCGITHHQSEATVTQVNVNIEFAYVIVILLDGEGEFTDHFGRVYKLKSGDGFQRIPNLSHKFVLQPQKNYKEMWLHIPRNYYENIRKYGFNFENTPVFNLPIDKNLVNQFDLIIQEIRDLDGPDLVNVLFKMSRLAYSILSQNQKIMDTGYHQKVLDEACGLIKNDLYKNSNLPELLSSLPISYERLRKIFKDMLGMSPGAYRIQQRVHLAQQLLLTRKYTIGELSDHLCYPDSFTFSKQFKKCIGSSPEQFLKSFFSHDTKHVI